MKFLAKTDNQSVEEWIGELQTDCLELHMLAKHEVISVLPTTHDNFFMMLMEYSQEPHYKMLHLLGFYKALNDSQSKEESLLKIMRLVDECRSLVKKIKAQSPNDRFIRTTAEYCYMNGSSEKKIVEELIEAGWLQTHEGDVDKFDTHFETHLQRIKRYVKGFPSFKRLVEMQKEGCFDVVINDADLDKQNEIMRSIMAKRKQ